MGTLAMMRWGLILWESLAHTCLGLEDLRHLKGLMSSGGGCSFLSIKGKVK